MALLTLNQINKSFNGQNAVSDLNLSIEPGAFVALLGPSGCGKSTTLRMLAGFEKVSSGSIFHGDRCLSNATTHVAPENRDFGMVFQSYALWPHMSVMENIAYPLTIKRVDRATKQKRIQEALAIVQLEPYADRSPAELSGGQRQRVALARSLVTEPEVILLDEPLANLDRHLRATMEETFRTFHKRTGATMVYVTHDQSEAMSLADQIAVLKNGQLIQWASPQSLYQQPRTAWLADFIGRGSVIRMQPSDELQPGRKVEQSLIHQQLVLPHTPSQGVDVLIRPQSVCLHPSLGISAKVTQCIYRGGHFDVELSLPSGQTLLAYHDTPLAVGETLFATVQEGWSLEPDHA